MHNHAPLHIAPKQFEGDIRGVQFKPLTMLTDHRGWLMELFRADELSDNHLPAMAYVSETQPGVVRGPHEHIEQSDYFAFIGPGMFKLYLWDARPQSLTYGAYTIRIVGESSPQTVIIPPGVVHAYKNLSEYPGWVFNAPNRLYAGHGRSRPVDEIRYENISRSPYHVD